MKHYIEILESKEEIVEGKIIKTRVTGDLIIALHTIFTPSYSEVVVILRGNNSYKVGQILEDWSNEGMGAISEEMVLQLLEEKGNEQR